MKSLMEFKNFWPIMNRIWPQYRDNEDKQTIHIKFLNHLSNHTITHPNVLELIKILLSVAPSTTPLERSYSKLSKICQKDRNKMSSKNMESMYILSALKNPQINYKDVLRYLKK